MTELLEAIGHNIRSLRDEKGWNQTELGFRAGASPSIISLIENGKRNPSTATLAKIAEALGVEVVDLFPKGRRSSPELSLFYGDDERPSVVVDGIVGLLEHWHARRLAEVKDPASLYFRNATSAALWVADTREEANDFCLFLSEWGRENLDAFKSVWDAVHLFGAGLALDNPAIAGEMRLREMADGPDELAARKMERAVAESQASMAQFQELGKAVNE